MIQILQIIVINKYNDNNNNTPVGASKNKHKRSSKWALSVVRVLIIEPRNGIVDRDLDQDEERIT